MEEPLPAGQEKKLNKKRSMRGYAETIGEAEIDLPNIENSQSLLE